MQPDSVTVPAQIPPVPSSCPNTRNPHDTALSGAASALFAHLSAVAPVLAHVETVLRDEPALRRQTELPEEEDMEIDGSSLPGKHVAHGIQASLP